ncbi:hypothetical protein H310_06237 [Aphanomyces invadans]|uniref:Uncharacterized protein n=1 Tax=Aphanomyces invadans TaxID=157072 RepID=A0A024U6S7_9STRA|nr:hypothetical protein H310_06237 [Aphanomyces invadans]ETW01597.1 hypothetical protein H310_06237 [Aphanomyces invadans]|eukprot:XP_008869445.1 hypothetical protein H310_06237 [Aphanomyces invadans]
MYAESSFEVTEENLEHLSEQGLVLKVQSIAGHKFVLDVTDYTLKALWHVFEAVEASWEPLKKLMKAIKQASEKG